MPVKVANISLISERSCACGSWLEHWKKFSKTGNSFLCSNLSCFEYPTLGGFVVKTEGDDRSLKIIPLCAPCSRIEGVYEVNNCTEFVSAAASGECCAEHLQEEVH